jgi:hypothetical protein
LTKDDESVKYQTPASLRSDGVAIMDQNRWPRSIGKAGQIPSDWLAKFIGIASKQFPTYKKAA